MRTTVIPAQITTVEDKIAGNLNLTQIVLLLVSLFVATFIYAAFPEKLHFSMYKIVLIIIQFFVFVTLSIRVKGKVVLNWVFILSNYYFRPGYYIYSKNDIYLRNIEPIIVVKKKKVVRENKATAKKGKNATIQFPDLIGVNGILGTSRANISIKFNKNGGVMNVSKINR